MESLTYGGVRLESLTYVCRRYGGAMHYSTIPQSLPGLLLAALLSVALVAGCGGPDQGEFRSYSELDGTGGPGAPGTDQASDTNEQDGGSSQTAAPTRPAGQGTRQARSDVPGSAAGDRVGGAAGSANGSAGSGVPDPRPAGSPPVESAVDEDGRFREFAAAPLRPLDPALAGERLAADAPVEAPRPEPREIKLLVPHQTFRVEGPDGAIRVSYDDIDLLRVLNMEPVPANCVDYFPDWLRELDGKRIRIRGFMYPPYQMTGIRHFVLARDNEICCMGRDPKRYDVIDVLVRKEAAANYIANRPFDVVGVFRIQPEDDDGELYQLYVIEDAFIIER